MRLLEEILESGRTPEEACAGAPELLGEVHAWLQRFSSIDAEIDAMFPVAGDGSSARRAPAADAAAVLPRIEGYSVEGVLGHGGMGVVYKARHLKLNRTVAIKMVLAGTHAHPTEFARFLREAKAVAQLRHPGIVQVYDAGDLEGLPYFTLEFVEGGNLGEKLKGTPLLAEQAAGLMVTLAEAVQVAHDAGIVHRDLKPGNILLTADGAPKVGDFGLARHFGEGEGLTLSGTRIGTPSYMPPEQAAGKFGDVGPAADVYSLGAILYELLTGRPPFRAATAAETIHQVVYQETVPPHRLNVRVPRDLETVCLKCLNKDPQRRYSSAAALADDLKRFIEGRPIQARPLGWGGRLWRGGRREPVAASFVATVLVTLGLAVGGGFWLQRQQALSRTESARQEGRVWAAVQAALDQAAALREQGRWPEVRAVLSTAPSLLDSSAPARLREALRRARADADLVNTVEEFRLRLAEGGSERRDGEGSNGVESRSYAEAFRKYGIDPETQGPVELAARVRDSEIHQTLLAFLHDWFIWSSPTIRPKLRALLERADNDPWRRAVRDSMEASDAGRLAALAEASDAPDQPPVVIAGVGNALAKSPYRKSARTLLRKAQHRHPGDFWINYQLGLFLQQDEPRDAAAYLRVAVAIRPTNDRAYLLLGETLRDSGDTDGAVDALTKALSLNPNRAAARELAKTLAAGHRLDVARVVWGEALRRDPDDHDAWYGYAQLCLFLGRVDEYRRTRMDALRRFEGTNDDWVIAERTSLAGLLLPASGDDLRRLVALAQSAIAAGPKAPHPDNAYLQFLAGLSAYREGRFDEAIPPLREAAEKLPNRAGPRLVLAMAEFQAGLRAAARRSLARAVAACNWEESHADHPTMWVNHILRREAEDLILPGLAAFVRGQREPADNDERIAMLGVCQARGLFGTAARFYAAAFAADPSLAAGLTSDCIRRAALEGQPVNRLEVLNSDGRLLAARCAAMVGCGVGADASQCDDAQRKQWRGQALIWLREDLVAWNELRSNGAPAFRALAREMLTMWQEDPDLSRLRDPDALKNLEAAEQRDWAAFWNDVGFALRDPA
jgi:serine/threonine-protein kinase